MIIKCPTSADERGSALLQIMFIAALLAIMAYTGMQMMTKADQSNIRMIRRNESITNALLLSDQVSNSALVKNLATTPSQLYQ